MDNNLPPGGIPSDVADNVDIKASEGEFIFPANVVRFLGVEKLENMVKKTQEKLAEMEQQDRVGGDDGIPPEDEPLPFDPSELEAVDDEPPKFAEGGMVDVPTGATTGVASVKKMKGPNGQIIYVPLLHGKPLIPVQEGWTEADGTETTDLGTDSVKPATRQGTMAKSKEENFGRSDPSPNEQIAGKDNLAGDPKDWSVDDFIDFGRNRDSAGNKAVKGLLKMLPGGAIALGARNKYLNATTASMFDKMIETGFDPQGNRIEDDKLTELMGVKDGITKQMGDQSGLNLNPAKGLTGALDQFLKFAGGGSSAKPADHSTKASSRPSGISGYAGASDSTGMTVTGGTHGMGSDVGRTISDPRDSSSISDGSLSSGGLYRKGGLVKRRNK